MFRPLAGAVTPPPVPPPVQSTGPVRLAAVAAPPGPAVGRLGDGDVGFLRCSALAAARATMRAGLRAPSKSRMPMAWTTSAACAAVNAASAVISACAAPPEPMLETVTAGARSATVWTSTSATVPAAQSIAIWIALSTALSSSGSSERNNGSTRNDARTAYATHALWERRFSLPSVGRLTSSLTARSGLKRDRGASCGHSTLGRG